jgi:hypothetical protein
VTVQARPATDPAEALIQALAADPLTAPYLFEVQKAAGGRFILRGRVSTRAVHDAAIRNALALGVPVVDELVIDTAELFRPGAIAQVPVAPAAAGVSPAGVVVPGGPPSPPLGLPTYDPMFGMFDPPLVSYPPWWPALSAYRQQRYDPAIALVQRQAMQRQAQAAGLAPPVARERELQPNTVEMTVDALGYARLRGTVPSEQHRQGIEARAARLPGVAGVINDLVVAPEGAQAGAPLVAEEPAPGFEDDAVPPPPPVPFDAGATEQAGSEAPPPPPVPVGTKAGAGRSVPPPPEPGFIPPADPAPGPEAQTTSAPALAPARGATMMGRLNQALRDDPALAGAAIAPRERQGVVVLEGRASSITEALHAFRLAQQAAGEDNVVEALEYPPPPVGGPNPLLAVDASEVEPYLLAQVRRHVAGQAEIDRLSLAGNRLVVEGRVVSEAARQRVLAILRTMPCLRGLAIEARLAV